MSKFRLTVEVDDLGDLTRTVQALEALNGNPGGVVVDTKPEPAAAPAKGKGGRKKTGKKAGKKAAAKAAPAASAIDDLIGGGGDEEAAERTKADVMQMFQRVGEEHGDDVAPAILAILQEHGCEKLSDLTEENCGSVYNALEAMLPS